MITELEQKNGAIKRKHEIKHGVEAAVQHQSRCMNNIFKRTIYYLCMHRFDDDVMKPVELSHYSNFRCMRAASEVDNGEKFPKFLSALYYTLRRVLDLDSTIRDDLLIVLAMLTPTSHNLASRFQSASEPQSDKWWAKFNCN